MRHQASWGGCAVWLPYDRTIEKASVYLTGGRPFSTLSSSLKVQLRDCQLIRNAIAHHSGYAQSQFEKFVISGRPLPPREKTPAGYLRSTHTAHPPQTRFEFLSTQLALSAQELS